LTTPQEETITIRTLQIPDDQLDDNVEYDVHNLEEYKKDLTWLKHAERIALKVHSRPGLRKLSQLSNKTLQQFLKEQIHYSTRDAIRKEIDKRYNSNQQYKSLNTSILKQWYEDTKSLEIHNELERRKRTKEIGSFSTCTNTQLQHVIRINTTHIKLNAVVTRDSNKRKESTPNESQVSTLTKKQDQSRTKERKPQLEQTEDAGTELNKHKDLFKSTLEIIEGKTTMEQAIVPSTEQPKKSVTQTTEEFRVTKEDYDKVLKDLLRVRPSRTEQEKALNEQALRERKFIQADEQATLEEKRRRKIEKKKRKNYYDWYNALMEFLVKLHKKWLQK
jgi:hypothetical protein